MANMYGDSTEQELAQATSVDEEIQGATQEEKRLTMREKLFISKFLDGLNAGEAATLAGYGPAMGNRLLRRGRVRRALDEKLKTMAMGAAEVLARLSAQARASLADCISDAGTLDLEKAKRTGALQSVKELEFHEETGLPKRLRMVDSQAALIALGKAHGLFIDRHQVDGQIQIQVEQTRSAMRIAMADPAALAAMIAAADTLARAQAAALPPGQAGAAVGDARPI